MKEKNLKNKFQSHNIKDYKNLTLQASNKNKK